MSWAQPSPATQVGTPDELDEADQSLERSDQVRPQDESEYARWGGTPYKRKERFPEGRILLTAMGEDMGYRLRLTEQHVLPLRYDSEDKIYTGREVLEALKGDSIRLWVHYSHGSTKRIYGHNPRENKYYIKQGLATSPFESMEHPQARSLADLKKEMEYYKSIKFTHDAIIYLGACWVAKEAKDKTVFAQELARVTGVPVIAGGERTEPLEENSRDLVYSNNVFFYKFFPDGRASQIIGEYFELSDLIQEYKQKILHDQQVAKRKSLTTHGSD